MISMSCKYDVNIMTIACNALKTAKNRFGGGPERPRGSQGPKRPTPCFVPQIWEGRTKYSVIWYPRLKNIYGLDQKTLHFWYLATKKPPGRVISNN